MQFPHKLPIGITHVSARRVFVLELKVSKLFQTKTHPARRFLTNVLCLCRCLRSCPCLFILDMRCIFLRNVEGHILNYMW